MEQRKETKHFLREGGYSEKHSQKSWMLNFDGVFARQAKDGETFPAVALAVGAVRAKLTLNLFAGSPVRVSRTMSAGLRALDLCACRSSAMS